MKKRQPRELSRNQAIVRFDVILQNHRPIEQCLFHITVFSGGKTKSPCFHLLIHWLIKQITNTIFQGRKSLYCFAFKPIAFFAVLVVKLSSYFIRVFFSFPPSVWLYISAVLGGCFINGSIPLFYELTIETTYPIAEGIPMAVVTTSNHVACLLFLAALMIPGIGKSNGKLAPTSSLLVSKGNICKETVLKL